MLTIIDRYILRETLKSFFAILSVLMLILVSQGFMKILKEAATGGLSNDVIFELIWLRSIHLLDVVMPPAFFFAILYSLGRMYRDSEMIALAASGISLARVYKSYIILSIPVAALLAWLTLSLAPMAAISENDIKEEQKEQVDFVSAAAGRFNEFSQGDLVFYVESMSEDKKTLKNIFVQNRQHGELGIVTADEGYQYVDEKTGDRFVVLTRGFRYEGTPGNNDFSVGQFTKYGIRVSQSEDKSLKNEIPKKARSTAFLMNSNLIEDRVELQHRLLAPLGIFILTLVSIPLARSLPREGVYGRLLLAFLFYFVFVNIQAVSEMFMKNAVTPIWMGLWWVHVFMLILAGFLFVMRSPELMRKFLRYKERV